VNSSGADVPVLWIGGVTTAVSWRDDAAARVMREDGRTLVSHALWLSMAYVAVVALVLVSSRV
jgi:hypothetical protein